MGDCQTPESLGVVFSVSHSTLAFNYWQKLRLLLLLRQSAAVLPQTGGWVAAAAACRQAPGPELGRQVRHAAPAAGPRAHTALHQERWAVSAGYAFSGQLWNWHGHSPCVNACPQGCARPAAGSGAARGNTPSAPIDANTARVPAHPHLRTAACRTPPARWLCS